MVGLEAEADEAITGVLVAWMSDGPPRENARTMLDIEFYEATVAERYLVAYSVDDVRQRFVILWLRERPRSGSHG